MVADLSFLGLSREELIREELIKEEKEAAEAEAREDEVEVSRISEYIAAGYFDRAIMGYLKVLEKNPDDLEARAELTDLYIDCGLPGQAVEVGRVLIEKDPSNVDFKKRMIHALILSGSLNEAGDTYYSLAGLYKEKGETDRMVEAYRRALAIDGENAAALEDLARSYQERRMEKVASHHLRRLGELYLKKNQPEEAIRIYKELLSIREDTGIHEKLSHIYVEYGFKADAVKEYLELARRHMDSKSWPDAIKCYEQVAGLDRDNIEAHEKLVELYRRMGNKDKSVQEKFILADLYLGNEEIERAQKLYESILSERSDFHEARRRMVDIYLKRGEFRKANDDAQVLSEYYFEKKKFGAAIDLFEKLVEASPDQFVLQEKLLQFYMLKGDKKKAVEGMIRLAEAYEKQNSWDNAVKAYKKGLSIDERNPDFHHHLGRIYIRNAKDIKEALDEYARVMELAPDNKEAMQEYVGLLLKEGDAPRAIRILEKLIAMDSSYTDLRDEILNEYSSKVSEHPEDMKARFQLGLIYKELGNLDEAIEQFQRTRKSTEFMLASYNMLGVCFAIKPGFSMQDTAVKQFKRGLEAADADEEDKQELRYNLARLYEDRSMLTESLNLYNQILGVDINYRDVKARIQQIEEELSGSLKVTRLNRRESGKD
ncbi:MAG: tetratricopeptide repeat protein [Chloroflexi bacterium]|nr:tetratricopeptide repeat protein [Chloroflexota bacterium]